MTLNLEETLGHLEEACRIQETESARLEEGLQEQFSKLCQHVDDVAAATEDHRERIDVLFGAAAFDKVRRDGILRKGTDMAHALKIKDDFTYVRACGSAVCVSDNSS